MRVGILGLGSIGQRHADNIIAMGHEVFTYDPDIGKGTQTKNAFYHTDLDAVVIASPSTLHVEHLLSLDLYKTRVLVEKPIGATEEDAKILEGLIGLKYVSVGNNLRFHPGVNWARKTISDIGLIRTARFCCLQFNSKPGYMRDGVTLNWGAHEIDLALYLLGPAVVVSSTIYAGDTIAQILLQHDSGCKSHITLDYITQPQMRGFYIAADVGEVSVDLENKMGGFDWDQTYIDEMEDFLEYGGKYCATGADGLATLKIILEAKRMAGV